MFPTSDESVSAFESCLTCGDSVSTLYTLLVPTRRAAGQAALWDCLDVDDSKRPFDKPLA